VRQKAVRTLIKKLLKKRGQEENFPPGVSSLAGEERGTLKAAVSGLKKTTGKKIQQSPVFILLEWTPSVRHISPYPARLF
jgi:hypothetical protein